MVYTVELFIGSRELTFYPSTIIIVLWVKYHKCFKLLRICRNSVLRVLSSTLKSILLLSPGVSVVVRGKKRKFRQNLSTTIFINCCLTAP